MGGGLTEDKEHPSLTVVGAVKAFQRQVRQQKEWMINN